MTKLAQRQALVTIEPGLGIWATKSGGNVSADTTPVWDGGQSTPEMLASPATVENITCSRPLDDLRDLPELARLRRGVGKLRATITVQPTDENLFPIGSPAVYADALLVTFSEPEFDASSGDAQVVELEWAISTVA